MPRCTVLSSSEREGLFALPDNNKDLIQQYTFSESDLSIIRQHRGAANRMGFAIQLCYMRYPGIILSINEKPFPPLLNFVADQLKMSANVWDEYGKRDQTRREHLIELQTIFGFQTFSMESYQSFVNSLADLAWQTDKGIVLASALVQSFRTQRILLPTINVIERICAEAITDTSRRVYSSLTESLGKEHFQRLNTLLTLKEGSKFTALAWLRESPGASKARHILEHIERLKAIRSLDLPIGLDNMIHQNRLLKLAREGRQMTAHDLSKFEQNRRYATMIALILEVQATIIDEIIEMHDRIMGSLFARSQRNQEKLFQQSGKSINEKLRLYYRIGNALIKAKQNGSDPFVAIESVIPWNTFTQSLADTQKLAPSEDFDYLEHIKNGYSQIRRYAPALLDILQLKANPALKEILEAVEIIKAMNANQSRKVPKEAPIGFVRKRWEKFVFSEGGIDRCFYELCVLSELKNALRSGDVWVQGSRQFKDFEEYLLPAEKFASLKEAKESAIAVTNDCSHYLQDRLLLLEEQLETVNRLAKANELPDAIFTASGTSMELHSMRPWPSPRR